MMMKIISNSIFIVSAVSIIFLAYGMYLVLVSSKRNNFSLPFPFNSIYNSLSEVSVIKVLLEYLQRSFYLIYVNKAKSEVLASLCVTLIPAFSFILFSILNLFSPVWYLSLALLIVCMILPFYVLKGNVTKKCIIIRIKLLRSFTSFTSLLANGTIVSATEDMIFSSNSFIRAIYKEFLRIYRMNKSEGYEFLRYISGDSYSVGVIDALQSYDEDGEDPTDEVNKMCKQGLDIFTLQLLGFKGFVDSKWSAIVALAGCLGLKFFGNFLGNLMNFQYNEVLGFAAIVCVMLGFTLCFVFESNT